MLVTLHTVSLNRYIFIKFFFFFYIIPTKIKGIVCNRNVSIDYYVRVFQII